MDERGFTLIEALVAVVLLATIAVAFLRGMELSARGERLLERDAAALAVARGKLAEASIDMSPRTSAGTTDSGISWTMAVSEFASRDIAEADTGPRVFRIDVGVAWRDVPGRPARYLKLTTFRSADVP